MARYGLHRPAFLGPPGRGRHVLMRWPRPTDHSYRLAPSVASRRAGPRPLQVLIRGTRAPMAARIVIFRARPMPSHRAWLVRPTIMATRGTRSLWAGICQVPKGTVSSLQLKGLACLDSYCPSARTSFLPPLSFHLTIFLNIFIEF